MGGTPFPCHITEYLHSIAYRVPTYAVKEGHITPCVIKETVDYKAAVVTNPVSYLLGEEFSHQATVDEFFEMALRKACERDENQASKKIFVVIQFKENLGVFPAVDGQCVMFEDEGVEKSVIFDCLDAPAPSPEERTESTETVLTAVKAELEIAVALTKVFESGCFLTSEGKCLRKLEFGVDAHPHIVSPIYPTELTTRLKAVGLLLAKIESGKNNAVSEAASQIAQTFGERLKELVEALQLDESRDESYLKLWYLQLWHRVERFGDAFRPRLQLSNDNDLKFEKEHRNAIAHRGVAKINLNMVRSLQLKVFRLLKNRL